tara:strand:- start:217 stop:411 length:195 start_codon:yes stop_codon:yes gene_type:complete
MDDDQKFRASSCSCDFCVDTNNSIRQWAKYEEIDKKNLTHLQIRMLDIVRRIERRNEIRGKKNN